MTDLVGKKKLVINDELWGSPIRTENHVPVLDSSYTVQVGGAPVGMTFLAHGSAGYINKDNLRIAIGANWTEDRIDPKDDASPIVVGNKWGPLKLFYGQPLEIKYCYHEEDVDREYPGFITLVTGKFWIEGHFANNPATGEDEWIPGRFKKSRKALDIWKEKVSVIVSNLVGPNAPLEDGHATNPELNKYKRPNLNLWSGFIKTGIISDGLSYKPIIRNEGHAPGINFEFIHGEVGNYGYVTGSTDSPSAPMYYDHYHNSVSPFTEKEMLVKQPFGKAAFADVSTYYNNRINSKPYEKFIGGFRDKLSAGGYILETATIDTVLPSPYAFLRVLLNKFKIEDLYDLESAGSYYDASNGYPVYTGPQNTLFPHGFGPISEWATKFAFEMLTTYFGRVPPSTISKFIKSSFKNQDISAFFEDYINEWTSAHTSMHSKPLVDRYKWIFNLNFLDQRLSNIAFGSHVIKNLDKVEQIKKHFPFYSQIDFSTSVFTELGDIIKQLLLTKFFVNKIAEFNTKEAGSLDSYVASTPNISFYDYYEEVHYDNIKDATPVFALGPDAGPTAKQSLKKAFNLTSILQDYLDDPNYYKAPGPDGYSYDIQDYVTYLKSDLDEPMNMDEYNHVWKGVLGNILKFKLSELYKKHHRNYKDLIEGKPAYHEIIAYNIEKLERLPEATAWAHVQNFIVPNTSELDVFKYVDSQVRYGTDKIYKYRVNTIKIVFGCKYRYVWHEENSGFEKVRADNPEGIYKDSNWTDLLAIPDNQSSDGSQKYTATFGVEIHPDIVLMEDLYFQTPDIMISDNPPVAPDVNIVPYRAINNKILILLNGMIDTYRAKPVKILNTDDAEFDFIRRAQISPDDKILFSSDDPVSKYQIFRTEEKPKSYTDFGLIEETASTHYIDKILPNKKYYYTFRALDGHKHISNPTAMFEVELIDDHGAVKPMIRIYNFEEPKHSQAIKECQKYLMIKPNLSQVYYDGKEELDHMFNNVDDTDKRRFKIRVTSKSTGKKIDINVAFNKKAVT